jgi:hypothetical protein
VSAALKHILETVRERRSQRPVVIFDLDGTLYDNRPRSLRILHAFAAALPAEHARDARVLLALTAGELGYKLEDALRPRGVSEAVLEQAQRAWVARFFTDTACADDVPQRGAVPFARQLYDLGATVVYLTGRDTPNMLVGTVRALRDDGFPIGLPRVELVLKPTFDEPDTAFKVRMLDAMDELGVVVATFENEPGNANMFLARWPLATHVLLETQHAPGAPALDSRAFAVRDFTLDGR